MPLPLDPQQEKLHATTQMSGIGLIVSIHSPAAAQEVFGNVQSDRTFALARSDKGNAGRLEQEIEVPDRHGALRRLRLGYIASASRPQRRDLISYFRLLSTR